jgi:hypothetical protein
MISTLPSQHRFWRDGEEKPFLEAFAADDQSCFMWYEGMTSSRSPARKRRGRRVIFGMRFMDLHFSLQRIGAR